MLDTVSSQPNLGYLALAIALIALIVAGGLYLQVSNVNKKLERIDEKLSSLSNQIEESGSNVTLLAQRLDELSQQVQELREKGATVDQVQELAQRLSEIAAQIVELTNKTGANAEDVTRLSEKLENLTRQLEELRVTIQFPVEIIDGVGDRIVIVSRPTRIVSLAPSVTEDLYFVGALDRLVGVDSYSDWPEWVAEARQNGTLVDVGGFWNPSVEAILSANPDLVVGVANVPSHESLKDVLGAYGIPVILLPQDTLDDIEYSLLILGKATGNIVQAAEAAVQFRANVSKYKLVAPQEPPKVALIIWLSPAWVAANNTFQSSVIELVGGVNAFSYLSGWLQVSPEEFLNAAPDIIIAVNIPVDQVYQYFNETLGEDATQIPAIANDRVYCIGPPYSDMFNRPSPRIVAAIAVTSLIINPQAYGISPGDIPACINGTTLPQPPEPISP